MSAARTTPALISSACFVKEKTCCHETAAQADRGLALDNSEDEDEGARDGDALKKPVFDDGLEELDATVDAKAAALKAQLEAAAERQMTEWKQLETTEEQLAWYCSEMTRVATQVVVLPPYHARTRTLV